jgi:nucleoside-diphosphate-sugar epimerase
MNDEFRVAVLGAGGHTGRFVVDALRERNAKVIAATRAGRFTTVGGCEEECFSLDFSQSEASTAFWKRRMRLSTVRVRSSTRRAAGG